jgi:hypothetical protein
VREVLSRGRTVDGGGEARGAIAGWRRDGGGTRGHRGGEAVEAAAVVVVRSKRTPAEEEEEEAERRGGGRHEGPRIGAAANLPYMTRASRLRHLFDHVVTTALFVSRLFGLEHFDLFSKADWWHLKNDEILMFVSVLYTALFFLHITNQITTLKDIFNFKLIYLKDCFQRYKGKFFRHFLAFGFSCFQLKKITKILKQTRRGNEHSNGLSPCDSCFVVPGHRAM